MKGLFKGTKGKWRVVKSDHDDFQIRSSNPELIVFDVGYDEHDAHLVAASPELLEAAISAWIILSDIPEEFMDDFTKRATSSLKGAINKALNIESIVR